MTVSPAARPARPRPALCMVAPQWGSTVAASVSAPRGHATMCVWCDVFCCCVSAAAAAVGVLWCACVHVHVCMCACVHVCMWVCVHVAYRPPAPPQSPRPAPRPTIHPVRRRPTPPLGFPRAFAPEAERRCPRRAGCCAACWPPRSSSSPAAAEASPPAATCLAAPASFRTLTGRRWTATGGQRGGAG